MKITIDKEELELVIKWLTGFDEFDLQLLIKEKVTFRSFFERAEINKIHF